MRKIGILASILIACAVLSAGMLEEAMTLKSWLDVPFSSTSLENERDARIRDLQNPVKGEFETTAQFEQRKKEASNRMAAIRSEYEQKIRDARTAHDQNRSRLQQRLNELLNQSRETIEMSGSLGAYDADTQRFKVSTTGRSFDVVVPLDKAPGVKSNLWKLHIEGNASIE